MAKKKDSEGGEKPKDPYKDMECFNCNKKGHPARFCPQRDKSDDNSLKSSKSGHKSIEKQIKSIKNRLHSCSLPWKAMKNPFPPQRTNIQFLHVICPREFEGCESKKHHSFGQSVHR